jgi:hypothetical protein
MPRPSADWEEGATPFEDSGRATRRAMFKKLVWALVLPAPLLALPACEWDGQFTVLGYTTRPNYDSGIRTVRVPIFKNVTFWRGLEFDLTRAVVREIES